MPRTIRIDKDVRDWLDAHKRHRGESYNQVLCRVYGIDPDPDHGQPPTGPGMTATQRAVADALATGAAMTAAQITAAATISPAATGKALLHLEKAGLACRRRVRGNADRRWYDEWQATGAADEPANA